MLLEGIKTNTTLTSLSFGDNYRGEEVAVYMREALKINSTLTALSIDRDE